MKRGIVRNSPLIDEIELFKKTSVVFTSDLILEKVDEVTSAHGTDQATAMLYKYLLMKHKNFIATINNFSTSLSAPNQPTKIIIIPGMFYKEHGDIGGDGLLVRNIAEKFGFETETVEVLSRGSVLDNKEIILSKLRDNQHNNVWLVSLSKGSTEVRLALEELRGKNLAKNIKGWISIGGLINGTPHADKKLRTFLTKIIWYLTLKVLRIDYAVTDQIACRNKSLQKEMLLDSHIKVVHIVGFPLLSHVEPFLVKRYKTLAPSGPNDGIILLKDLIHISGEVYPVWGVDHFLRTSDMSGIIYKMCHYINNTN